jgi:LysM repeat protein
LVTGSRELTRYGVPAAFLAAVTIAVLLIKSGLGGGGGAAPTTTTGRALPSTTAAATRATTSKPTGAQYYTIQSGDTLGAIALREHTTVDELQRLNPGIDPLSLHTGSRIRVH